MNLPLSATDLSVWLGGYFLPFIRLSALFMAAPIFGTQFIAIRVRILLSLLVTIIVAPLLPSIQPIDFLSSQGLLAIVQQLAIGLGMAFILQMVFGAMVIAGQASAMTMGLGFALSVDPQNGVQVPVLSQFYMILATLIFLVLDLHLLTIRYLADSFLILPVDSAQLPAGLLMTVVAWATQMFIGALLIAIPVMTSILLVNITFGVITRVAPQLNIFAVGFPVTILAGFIVVLLVLPSFLPVFTELYTLAFEQILETLR